MSNPSSSNKWFLKTRRDDCWDSSSSSEDRPALFVPEKISGSSGFLKSFPQRKRHAASQSRFENLSQGLTVKRPKLSSVRRTLNQFPNKNKLLLRRENSTGKSTQLEIFLQKFTKSENTQTNQNIGAQSPNSSSSNETSEDEATVTPILKQSNELSGNHKPVSNRFKRSWLQSSDRFNCENTKTFREAVSSNKCSLDNTNCYRPHYRKLKRSLANMKETLKDHYKDPKRKEEKISLNKATSPQRKLNYKSQKSAVSRFETDSDIRSKTIFQNSSKFFKTHSKTTEESTINTRRNRKPISNLFSSKYCFKSVEEAAEDSSSEKNSDRVEETIPNTPATNVLSSLINILNQTNPEIQKRSSIGKVVSRAQEKENKTKKSVEGYFRKVKKRSTEFHLNEVVSEKENISNNKQCQSSRSSDRFENNSIKITSTIVEQDQHSSSECESTSDLSELTPNLNSSNAPSSHDSEQRRKNQTLITDYFSGWSEFYFASQNMPLQINVENSTDRAEEIGDIQTKYINEEKLPDGDKISDKVRSLNKTGLGSSSLKIQSNLSDMESKTANIDTTLPKFNKQEIKCCSDVLHTEDNVGKLESMKNSHCTLKNVCDVFSNKKLNYFSPQHSNNPDRTIDKARISEYKKDSFTNILFNTDSEPNTCVTKISGAKKVDTQNIKYSLGGETSYLSRNATSRRINGEIEDINVIETSTNQELNFLKDDHELLFELQRFDGLNHILSQSDSNHVNANHQKFSNDSIPEDTLSEETTQVKDVPLQYVMNADVQNKRLKSYNIAPNSLLYEDNMLNYLVKERDEIRRGMRIRCNNGSNDIIKSCYIKRYKKGGTTIFKLGTRYKQSEFKFASPEQNWREILDNIEGKTSDADSDKQEVVLTPQSYLTYDSESDVLSTGSGILPQPQKMLRSGINKLLTEKSLIFSENEDVLPIEFNKGQIKNKICEILMEVIDKWIKEGEAKDLKWPTDDMRNCVFKDNRELFYQLKPMITDQRTSDRVIHETSRLLGVGVWALNIIAQKGLVFGDMKLVMSSGEVVNCNVPGSQIPADVSDITEIQSTAYFILVVEKDSIFNKLIAEGLPNRLTRPFIMITGKGFPDLNTQLFLKKLWIAMSVPVFILVDPDPHGVGIMMNYRFGSVANSHVSDHLAIPKSRWLGVLPSEIQELRLPSEVLTVKDVKMLDKMLRLECVQRHPKIEEELRIMLKYKVKASIEGLIKCDTYLSNKYLNHKFYNNKYI